MNFIKTFFAFALFSIAATSVRADWPMFRGDASGTNSTAAFLPPLKWSETENVAWKTPLTGFGVSSPIVVKDRVIITSVTGVNHDRLHVFCYSTKDGSELWHRQFWATGRTLTHPTSSVAANTPASDGNAIYAFFSSNDLAAFDLEGNLLWFRGLTIDYPLAGNDVGMSASLLIHNGTLIVQSEAQGDAFILGIDAKNGTTKYRIDRPKDQNWTTSVLHYSIPEKDDSSAELITSGPSAIVSYSAHNGEQLWKIDAKCDPISSMTLHNDILYVPLNGLTTYRMKAFGEKPELLWNKPKLNPGAASPVTFPSSIQRVYIVNRSGVLIAADGDSGEVRWQLRMKGQFWATPLLVCNKIFLCSKEGLVQIVDCSSHAKKSNSVAPKNDEANEKQDDEKKTEGKLLAENKMDSEIMAGPAIKDAALYIRTKHYLWKIADPKDND